MSLQAIEPCVGVAMGSVCYKCPGLHASRSQVVAPTPCPPYGLLAIGEAPGADEDEFGEGFVGTAGVMLDALLSKYGLERNADYGVANIVRCRPPGNRKPTRQEIAACLPMLAEFLIECRPAVLLLVGKTAVEVFMGNGDLLWHIERSARTGAILLASRAHPVLQQSIRRLHALVDGVRAIPMPHTSGMVWNRKAPNGKLWREVGEQQAAIAATILHRLPEIRSCVPR